MRGTPPYASKWAEGPHPPGPITKKCVPPVLCLMAPGSPPLGPNLKLRGGGPSSPPPKPTLTPGDPIPRGPALCPREPTPRTQHVCSCLAGALKNFPPHGSIHAFALARRHHFKISCWERTVSEAVGTPGHRSRALGDGIPGAIISSGGVWHGPPYWSNWPQGLGSPGPL